ncbi:MAG: TIGR00341 family protein [Cypionkella sp.]
MNDTRGGAFAGVARKAHGRAGTLASIARDSRLTRGFLLQIVLSAAIAHIGLLLNSAPVIIGAMLISPLLAPIMAFGFAIATFDGRLLRRALQTFAAGTLAAIAVAWLLTMLSPITEATPAILARVRPSLLDLMVAIFGGVAGAYALLRKFSATMVGVAIATALIPPLATVGWALATGDFGSAGGALLLYVTNTAAIGFMATVVARFNGFGTGLSPRQTWLQSLGIFATLGVLAVPLAYSLSAIVRETRARAALRAELVELAGEQAAIERFEIDFDRARPAITAVVITPRYIGGLEENFAHAAREALGDTRVGVIQLRSGSAEADAARSAAAAAAEERALTLREAERLRAALAAVTRAQPAAVTVDQQRRRALVELAPEADEAVDLAPLRAAFPDWSIAVVPARQPAEETAP